MILDLYTCLWNEARLLPYFLDHYGPHCRRIVVMDDGSTDGTLEILAAHPAVEIRRMPRERDSWVLAVARWKNEGWKESYDADWVIHLTVDEIVGPDLTVALERHQAAGATVLRPRGFDMIAEDDADPATVDVGVFNPQYSKPCLFRPDKITNLTLAPGSHDASFEGEVVLVEPEDLILRHYRYLGREQTWARYKELDAKRRGGDKVRQFGAQYAAAREEFDASFDEALANAERVPS
ncbi:glycosyltransferase family 2 protein [Sporichthya sp.]|uniref:glycosyltransferase family 2 protein n=1 Tax=Sporichthya sp. TaxID=65475 RepID=UPI0017F3057E|nr:glycosyltransferase family 2 protein [Sporichthya sp.]MBA3744830.1 glycosyltransferase family 2 protein [Sporichthya sp.]